MSDSGRQCVAGGQFKEGHEEGLSSLKRRSCRIQELASNEGNQKAHLMAGIWALKVEDWNTETYFLPNKVHKRGSKREEFGVFAACGGRGSKLGGIDQETAAFSFFRPGLL